MRAALSLAVVVAACGGGRVPLAHNDAEQARFDRDRQPARVVEALGIGPGDAVADIGAGPGLMTVHLARAVEPAGRVVATDVDPAALRALARRVERAGVARWVEGRAVAPGAPGLEPNAFDAVLLARVDQDFPDRVAWLRAVAPALRPGGRLVIANRIYRRDAALAAAEEAGLRLVSESTDVPGEFVAVFAVEELP